MPSYLKALTATTTGTPKSWAFSTCFLMLQQPASSRARFCKSSNQLYQASSVSGMTPMIHFSCHPQNFIYIWKSFRTPTCLATRITRLHYLQFKDHRLARKNIQLSYSTSSIYSFGRGVPAVTYRKDAMHIYQLLVQMYMFKWEKMTIYIKK